MASQNRKRITITDLIAGISAFFKKAGDYKNTMNQRMEGKSSPARIAGIVSLIGMIIMIIILFMPNYLGVADDGSFRKTMDHAGLSYIQADAGDNYNNYFVKEYQKQSIQNNSKFLQNSQSFFIKAAEKIDDFFTGDSYFDIRFLAGIYFILYIPALFLIIKQVCIRVKTFSEGVVIGIAGLLIFTDVAYMTYFNSLYPEAIWIISLTYTAAAALSFQNNQSFYKDLMNIVLYNAGGIILIMSRQHTAVLGIVLGGFCLNILFIRKRLLWKVICSASSFLLVFIAIAGIVKLEPDFDETSKFHAMTRGVLLQASNPEKALSEFGINASYEVLTDASSYDLLPLVQAENPVLKEDFLEKYTSGDIAAYYARHPSAFFKMIDASIKSCFGIRREYCGNYEESVGLAKRARTPFWCGWSTFKVNLAPKTIGFFLILFAAVILLFRKEYRSKERKRRKNIVLDSMIVLFLICLIQASVVSVNSGDAEMVQHCFLVTYSMDIISYCVLAEIVHRVSIF